MRRFAQAIADTDSLPPGLPDDVAQALVDAPDRYNVAKGKPAIVIATTPDGRLAVTDMQWGLVPSWSKEPATPYTTVTARLERAPRSRIFARAWKERHCVVPMTGYYKWDRQRKPPWPRFVQDRTGITLLAAGLWERWEDDADNVLLSFSLLTGPNAAIPPPLTQDGPVFLDPKQALRWLSGAIGTPASLRNRAHRPSLESYPVSRTIRDAAAEGYTLLEPVDPDADALLAPAGSDVFDAPDDED